MATSSAEADQLSAARERRWFLDLEQGTGEASALDDSVRRVLRLATVDIAADLTSADRVASVLAERQRVADQRERERLAKAERERVRRIEQSARIERANEFDILVIVGWFWLAVTLIAPWLVGFFILKDGPLLPRAGGVFDTDARDYLDYFWALVFAGFGVISIVVAAVLLLRSWRGRWFWGVTVGLILAVGAPFFVLPHAQQLWRDSEAETLQELTTGAFPFSQSFFTCGMNSLLVTDSNGEVARWQVHTARRANSTASGCNRLVVYKGWERIAQIDADDGREFDSRPQVNEGTTTADTVFTVDAVDGTQISVPLSEYDSGWADE